MLHHLGLKRRCITLKLWFDRRPVVEGQTAQAAATETMDGGDVSAVELLECHQQPSNSAPSIRRRRALLQPCSHNRIGRLRGRFVLQLLQAKQRLLQTLTNPRPQFLSGRLGVGHNKQCFKRVSRLCDQTKGEVSQREGFARSSTGFQQTDSRLKWIGIGVKALSHGCHQLRRARKSG